MARKPSGRKNAAAIRTPKRKAGATVAQETVPPFSVVGVGASAGGLAAVTDLLKHLSRDTAVAVVIVQHLDPRHGSLTSEILSRVSPMPVAEVKDGMRVQPHHVYVIPPNAGLTISRGVLKLLPRAETRGPHLPIDLFFRSLAEDQHDLAIGVVLSGVASDGTLGVQAIKAEGGFTFAQDPTSAQYDGMPRSAIASGAVDVVETPQGIAAEIARMSRLFPAAGERARTVPPPLAEHGPNGNLRKIFASVRSATGIDFTHYKHTTIRRRIARRLFLLKIEDLQTYATYLGAHPEEVKALYADILIHVTGFFRDRDAYEHLKVRILPKLLENWDPNVPFRVWVPGCSTGEEAYSIAITFFEFVEKARGRPRLQILASDISETSLQTARSGVYPDSIAKDVSKARLARFFEKVEGGYRIAKSVREACLFSRHDVTADPPFAKIDLISCRNVLIYFASDLQKRVVPIIHYALNPGGVLWLGRSETIGGFGSLFTPEDRTNKFYSKKTIATPLRAHFPVGRYLPGSIDVGKSVSSPPTLKDVQAEADRVAIQQYAPPGVVINDALEILQVRGRPAPYLELAPGQASLDLFKLAHPDIVADLRYLINAARTGDTVAAKDGLTLKRKHGERERFGIRVAPIHLLPHAKDRYFSVFFEEHRSSEHVLPSPARGAVRPNKKRRQAGNAQWDVEERKYEEDLKEYETAQEELIASNEELQATNEELQSTNEELETAKEELQSANEEMTTINDELQNRNAEMGQLSNDLTNLLASVDLPIVMVGPDTKIRRFTPRASQTLNLIPSDIGRPLGDIKPDIQGPVLEDIVAEVISSLTIKEAEVEDKQGSWYRLQVRPYRTADNRIDGAVIALADITALKRIARELGIAHDDARHIIETMPTATLVISPDRRVQRANEAFYSLFKVAVSDTEGRLLSELCDGCWNIPSVLSMVESVLSQGAAVRDFELDVDFPLVGRKSMILHATATRLTGAGGNTALLAIEDVTARKLFAGQLREAEQNLLTRETEARHDAERANESKDAFLATLSHELRTPLSTILNWVHLLRLGGDGATKEKGIAAIEKSAKDQNQLIEDLLDISRIQAGKLHLELRDVDPTGSFTAAIESVRGLADANGVRLLSEFDPSVCWICADAGRIEQVLQNLLTNAIKFTPRGGTVTVRSRRKPDPDRFEIQVQDTGKGIKPEFLPKLFARFSQEDSTTQRAYGGLGLGLSIVRNLVELHDGTVTAESPGDGKGATFTVTLPCAPPRRGTSTASVNADHGMTTPTEEVADLKGIRVLMIDDREDARQAFLAILEALGAQVLTAASAAEGIQALAGFKPDVVLCDIAMPVEDGFSFIRKVRALKPSEGRETRVAALSAYAGSAHSRRSLDAGFDIHLAKPIDAVNLSRAIVKLAGSLETGALTIDSSLTTSPRQR